MSFLKNLFAAAVVVSLPLSAAATSLLNLDADDLTLTDGDTVTSWGPATGSGTPTYRENSTPGGFAAVEFDGGDHFGTLAASFFPTSGTGDFIVAGLIKATNIGAYQNIIDDAASNRPMLWIDPAFNYELNYSGGGGAKAVGTGQDGWDVFIANSRTNQLFINSPTANATGGSAVAYTSAEAFDLFNRNGGQRFRGLVADLRVYNDVADLNGGYAGLYNDLSSKLAAPVPVPASLPLMLGGAALLGVLARRRKS